MKVKILLLTVFCISLFQLAQSQQLPATHPVAIAAPHRPQMLRHDGSGKAFYGEKHVYDKYQNEEKLKTWVKNFPDEYKSYKEAIAGYLKDKNINELTEESLNEFYDLKAQWTMIKQLFNLPG